MASYGDKADPQPDEKRSSADRQGASGSPPRISKPILLGSAQPWRGVMVLASLFLMWNGIDGLNTYAESRTSLIAANIRHRGGQSFGMGLALLAVAMLPSNKGE